ncbi:MAG: hypothetical protein OJF50_003967 [Nitrospira sp.]|nr:hypothetical protein [Nitrospira sp.]
MRSKGSISGIVLNLFRFTLNRKRFSSFGPAFEVLKRPASAIQDVRD